MPGENNGIPKLFISYAHDDRMHKNWVLQLSNRLVANGVDVVLDQWNLALGGDLPRFMESGLVEADRVLAICSEEFVRKANSGQGGVGYEKMILTAQVMNDISSPKIIPVLRQNTVSPLVPTFLSTRVYIDFREDEVYEDRYEELVREIHGDQVLARPPLGRNPFGEVDIVENPVLPHQSERYNSPGLIGEVTFDYSNNNGRYVIGSGDLSFETAWSGGSTTSIHAYSDTSSIRYVSLAAGVSDVSGIDDASIYDTSSRVRSPRLGEIVVWRNRAGYYAATQIDSLKSRSHGNATDEVLFSYKIQSNRTSSFQ